MLSDWTSWAFIFFTLLPYLPLALILFYFYKVNFIYVFSFYYELNVLSTNVEMILLKCWHSTLAVALLCLSDITQFHLSTSCHQILYVNKMCFTSDRRHGIHWICVWINLTMIQFNLWIWYFFMWFTIYLGIKEVIFCSRGEDAKIGVGLHLNFMYY